MALDTTEGPRKISGEKLALGALFAEISLRLRSYRQRFENSVKAHQRRARSKGWRCSRPTHGRRLGLLCGQCVCWLSSDQVRRQV